MYGYKYQLGQAYRIWPHQVACILDYHESKIAKKIGTPIFYPVFLCYFQNFLEIIEHLITHALDNTRIILYTYDDSHSFCVVFEKMEGRNYLFDFDSTPRNSIYLNLLDTVKSKHIDITVAVPSVNRQRRDWGCSVHAIKDCKAVFIGIPLLKSLPTQPFNIGEKDLLGIQNPQLIKTFNSLNIVKFDFPALFFKNAEMRLPPRGAIVDKYDQQERFWNPAGDDIRGNYKRITWENSERKRFTNSGVDHFLKKYRNLENAIKFLPAHQPYIDGSCLRDAARLIRVPGLLESLGGNLITILNLVQKRGVSMSQSSLISSTEVISASAMPPLVEMFSLNETFILPPEPIPSTTMPLKFASPDDAESSKEACCCCCRRN